jgi:hypothetical protein
MFDYCLLIVVELYPAGGTSPGTLKLVTSLYYQFGPFDNHSVVLILRKTKALGVLERFVARSLFGNPEFASTNPETRRAGLKPGTTYKLTIASIQATAAVLLRVRKSGP